nr:calmodulin-like protein 1 [Terebratalia transversa]UYM80457.1 calmodulin-like protein 4 [Terebratalia transversa]
MFDKNHDYGLSIEEFVDFFGKVEELKDQLHQAWKELDTDGNGFVDMEEAKKGMRKYGMSDEETERLVKLHSARSDGRLNYNEFKSFWKIKF